MKITYKSNNSGGYWWLEDEDWKKLEDAGWSVDWVSKWTDKSWVTADDGRYLGALAKEASKEFETPADAMNEFESITGQKVTDEGCNCCGAPHRFCWGEHSASGEECLTHMFSLSGQPRDLREAVEMMSRGKS